MNMTNDPIVALDIETTGASVLTDRIVEIAMIRQELGQITERVIRLNPNMPIHPMASQVHGIYDRDVTGFPAFDTKANEIREMLDGATLVGFNLLNFDLPIIQRQMMEAGPELRLDLDTVEVVDLMAIYHHIAPRTLDAASRQFLGKPLEGAHDALADTRCVLELIPAMVREAKEDLGNIKAMVRLTDELVCARKVAQAEDGECYFRFGKHAGKSFKEVMRVEPSYFTWAVNQTGMGRRAIELFRIAIQAHKNIMN